MCKKYNVKDYYFSQYIVSRCIPDTSDDENNKYIRISCHKVVVEANPENMSVPYFVKNRCVNAGVKFLKALQEKPQYLCTCCHRILFHKTVVPFHLQEYDMTNDTFHYRMKLHKNQTSQQHCQTEKSKNQACGNGLKLDDTPQDLQQLFTLKVIYIVQTSLHNNYCHERI